MCLVTLLFIRSFNICMSLPKDNVHIHIKISFLPVLIPAHTFACVEMVPQRGFIQALTA